MITQNRLNAAPAVALVASFVAVLALGKLLAVGGDTPILPVPTTSSSESGDMTVVRDRPGRLWIELHRLRAPASFANEDIEATVTATRRGDLVEVCLTLPDGTNISDEGWEQLSDRTIRTFCRTALRDGDIEVRLEQT